MFPGIVAPGRVAVPRGTSSYPGGKSGPGIYQRLINQIPRHRILISAFAGQCGVTRNIKPAEHTIVIDADAAVCEWWDSWRRSKQGRHLEIHHSDSIEWLCYRFGLTEYSATGSSDAAGSVARDDGHGSRTKVRPVMAYCDRIPSNSAAAAGDVNFSVPAVPADYSADVFIFADPPYVLSERSHGKQYQHELSDGDHGRLLSVLLAIPRSTAVMLCGYRSQLYAAVDREWRSVDHRVPTRGGLQDERIWMNYPIPTQLHDYSYIGECRRSRERIRRRQRNWVSQLQAMTDPERSAMLEILNREFME